jgi:PAS domain S-box-containing protein
MNAGIPDAGNLHQRLLLHHPLPTWVIDPVTFNIRFANKAAISLYGYSAEDISGLDFSDLFSGESGALFFQRLQSGEANFQLNSLHRDSKGNTLDVELHVVYVQEDGVLTVSAIHKAGNDVQGVEQAQVPLQDTELRLRESEDRFREADEKLKKSEQFYRTLIADSLDGMLLVDASGIITFCSPSVKNVLGYEPEDLQGLSSFNFVHPDDIGWASESFQKEVMEDPEVKFIVVRLLKKDGNWLWCMVRGHNLLKSPSIGSIVIYFHDDTLRKQATEALRESERRFRILIRDLHTGVFLQDANGYILMSNKVMYELFNIEEKDIVNQQIWNQYTDVVHEDGRPFELEERPGYRAIQTKQLVADTVMGVWNPSIEERVWLTVSSDPILDENGEIRHVVTSFSNITERKKLQEELFAKQINHQRQLTQASIDGQEKERREIGKELHDNIGQQLTTIKLFLDLAKTTTDESASEMVAMSLNGIADVINAVRGMSRSLIPSTLKDLGLIESIQELTDSIKRAQTLDIHIDCFDFEEDMLPENQKLTVFRMVQEQLNNIVKHSGAEQAWIELRSSNGLFTLQLRDDGRGFDLAKTRKGLGFINISNRAELFNGKAEIISQLGEGCTVLVFMPLNQVEPSAYVISRSS